MKTISKIKIITLLIGAMLILPVFTVFAQDIGQLGLEYGTATGLGVQDIRLTVARIIRAFLGLLGIIALAIIIYGGYLWMTSGGNEEKVTRAKQFLINGAIGLAIILSAFAIVQFVILRLVAATLGLGPGERGRPGGVASISGLSNALGAGVIREHYPARDASSIPRNVKIILTFKEQISPASLVLNYDEAGTPEDITDDRVSSNTNGTADESDDFMELNTELVKIYPSEEGTRNSLENGQAAVNFTDDLKTWVFDPVPLLGSPSNEVWYTVELKGGRDGVRRLDGEPIFGGVYNQGYTWEFQVSTFVDVTPPKITSVIPREERECAATGGRCARNVIITVNFDEALDPTSVSGIAPAFTNLIVDSNGSAAGGEVSGEFVVANQYRTVEFTPQELCGTNSCGGNVYCLPSNSDIAVTLRAASLSSEPPEAAFPYPFDGITDVVGNSLDGNANGTSEGPSEDNYSWTFSTSNIVDLTPPRIENINPAANASNIDVDAPMTIVFSEFMRMSTLNNENVNFLGAQSPAFTFNPSVTPWYGIWNSSIYWPNGDEIENDSDPVPTGNTATTRAELRHGTLMVDTSYYPEVTSRVQDLYQNCMFPPNQSAGPLQCATSAAEPYCCLGQGGAESCANSCTLSSSGNPICQE